MPNSRGPKCRKGPAEPIGPTSLRGDEEARLSADFYFPSLKPATLRSLAPLP